MKLGRLTTTVLALVLLAAPLVAGEVYRALIATAVPEQAPSQADRAPKWDYRAVDDYARSLYRPKIEWIDDTSARGGYGPDATLTLATPYVAGVITVVCIIGLWRRHVMRRAGSRSLPTCSLVCFLAAALLTFGVWIAWHRADTSVARLAKQCAAEKASQATMTIRRLSDGVLFRGPRSGTTPAGFEILPGCARDPLRRLVRSEALGHFDWSLTPSERALVRAVDVADGWWSRLWSTILLSGALVLVGAIPFIWYFALARIRELACTIRGEGLPPR